MNRRGQTVIGAGTADSDSNDVETGPIVPQTTTMACRQSVSDGSLSDGEAALKEPTQDVEKPKDAHSGVSQARVLFLVCGHAACAASLLVVNKWALKRFPYVWTLATIQFVFASAATYVAGKVGVIEVDALDFSKLARFFPAAGMFFVTITAGNAVVGVSNVDTFIVMRSVVPIPSAILESLALGEPCPHPKSWGGLAIILLGAVGYCSANQGMVVGSMAWVLLYLALMPLDGVLIKHLVGASGLSPWGLVLYNNVCAGGPGLFFSLILESELIFEPGLAASYCTFNVLLPCILSCFAGLAISFFQLNVRKVISSTAFMVLGVSNKFLSVLINQLASLDANRDIWSLGSVLTSIAGAIIFQQTVQGRGISQAPKSQGDAAGGSGLKGCLLVIIALAAAASITFVQGQAKVDEALMSTTTETPSDAVAP